MDWINENWPLLLGIAALFFVVTGIVKKIIQLAIFAGIIAVVAFVAWPYVSESI